MFVRCLPVLVQLDQIWLTSTKFEPCWEDVGPKLAQFAFIRWADFGPIWAEFGVYFGQSWAELGQIWPMLANLGTNSSKVDELWAGI